jgi:hypothetical protein
MAPFFVSHNTKIRQQNKPYISFNHGFTSHDIFKGRWTHMSPTFKLYAHYSNE